MMKEMVIASLIWVFILLPRRATYRTDDLDRYRIKLGAYSVLSSLTTIMPSNLHI